MMSHRGARGNVTYSGPSANSLNDMADYFHLKYVRQIIQPYSIKKQKINSVMFVFLLRLTYVPIDPSEVKKHGFPMAIIHQLQNNVSG